MTVLFPYSASVREKLLILSVLETSATIYFRFILIIYDVVNVDVHCIFLLICSPEIRTEAVMQALAMSKKQSMAPMPSKRTSAVYNQKNRRHGEQNTGVK